MWKIQRRYNFNPIFLQKQLLQTSKRPHHSKNTQTLQLILNQKYLPQFR
jgi:hypothetical protein